MRKIYLVRHGQSTANAGADPEPNAQIALTELGRAQAQEVADWLIENLDGDIDSINISKFIRTQQTAEPLIDKIGGDMMVIEGLHEFDYLSLKAMEGTDLDTRYRMAEDFWVLKNPDDLHGDDAESYRCFYDRVAEVLTQFKTLPQGNHVAYTHGLWISMLIWQILGQPSQSNEHMRKFRQFELSIRAQNCEVFCLMIPSEGYDNHPPAITKVRTC